MAGPTAGLAATTLAAAEPAEALTSTRLLLSSVAEIAASAPTLVDAAERVIDVLCDDVWPVAHLYLRDGDEFVDSGKWSSRTSRDYPQIIDRYAATVARLPIDASAVTRALTNLEHPQWLSWHAGSAEVGGTLSSGVLPARARMMEAVGLRTGMACPIRFEGRAVGLLEILSPQERTREPEELATIDLVGRLLSRVVEREQTHDELDRRRELTAAIAHAIPDALVVYDVDSGQVIEHSGDWVGAGGDEVIGRHIDQLCPPSMFDLGQRSYEEVTAQLNSGLRQLFTVRGRAGEPDRLMEAYREEAVVGGRTVAVIFSRDVTSREAERAQFADASGRARAMVETTAAGIFELDPDTRIDYVNPRGAQLLNQGEDALRGTRLTDLLPFVADSLTDGPPQSARSVRRCSGTVEVSGRPVTLHVAVASRSDRTGERRRIVTVTDVTAAERGARLETQHKHALAINDSVVQGVATALYGLELGDTDVAVAALRETLDNAKRTVAALLSETGLTPQVLREVAASGVQQPVRDGGGATSPHGKGS